MFTLRRFVPCLVLGLTIVFTGISLAQNANQTTGDNKQSCCCMSSGCCGDSCPMKKGEMKNHATSSDKEECCSCCGDSCPLKGEMKNHATSSNNHACCGCCGDSCQTMKKGEVKNHATSSDKSGCCCGGDSCELKDGATTAKGSAANTSSKDHECCCCGDSCEMKDMKNMKDMKEKP